VTGEPVETSKRIPKTRISCCWYSPCCTQITMKQVCFLCFLLLGLRLGVFGKNKTVEFDLDEMPNKLTPLTLEMATKVPCPAIPRCSLQTNFSIDFAHGIMANNVKKILMEITPKVGCSLLTAMFLDSMGFKYGVVYNSSSNFFRQHYFFPKCGRGGK
jgi:hypothetical protein